MLDNLLLKTDSYKLSHFDMYPPKTTGNFAYFESRDGAKYPYTLFFGLQYLLKRYLEGPVVTAEKIDEAEAFVNAHIGPDRFNRDGWERILNVHGGHLPILIRAVPEGLVVPVSNALMTVENTDPEAYWLPNYVETLLTHVWYSSTVATLSYSTKQMIKGFLQAQGCDLAGLDFMLHDFGYRGATSDEAAAIGGLGHLINFKGSDTIAAVGMASEYYHQDPLSLAFSVPATEHSIMTAEGKQGEIGVLDRLLKSYPTGILSVVADSYNIYDFVRAVNDRKGEIVAREGKFVVRPDSCTAKHSTPEEMTVWIVEALWDTYGGSKTPKGFKVLDPHIGVLWGDGIDQKGIKKILLALEEAGFAASNMVFGMGGGLLQKVNRDTQRFAFKSSAQKTGRRGQWRSVQKKPLDASKTSKGGRLKLVNIEGTYLTIDEAVKVHGGKDAGPNLLEPVFADGSLLRDYTFAEIRERAEAG